MDFWNPILPVNQSPAKLRSFRLSRVYSLSLNDYYRRRYHIYLSGHVQQWTRASPSWTRTMKASSAKSSGHSQATARTQVSDCPYHRHYYCLGVCQTCGQTKASPYRLILKSLRLSCSKGPTLVEWELTFMRYGPTHPSSAQERSSSPMLTTWAYHL